MNLFIRLKSNTRYAVNLDGILRDTLNIHVWTGERDERKHSFNDVKAAKGNHTLYVGEESYVMPGTELIDEIKQISATTGISLAHGK